MKDVSTYIAALVEYAVERKLIEGADRVWARNQLLAAHSMISPLMAQSGANPYVSTGRFTRESRRRTPGSSAQTTFTP